MGDGDNNSNAAASSLDEEMKALIEKYGHEACLFSLNQQIAQELEVTKEQLHLSEAVLDACFDACFLTDAQGNIVRTNPAALKKFGYDCDDELVGKNIATVIGGDHAQHHSRYFELAISSTKETLDGILGRMRHVPAKRKDGSEFPVKVGISVVHCTKNKEMFVAFCRDLTHDDDQRNSIATQQKTIQQQADLQKSILDSSFDAIVVIDEQGAIQQCNQTTLKEFGYAEMSDLIGRDVAILVGGGDSTKHGEYMKRFNDKNKTSTILGQSRQVMSLRKDGTEFPCRIGIKMVPDTNLLVGFIRDITEEQRSRDSIVTQHQSIVIQKAIIQQQADLHKSILDSSFDAIVVVDEEGTIQQCNQTTLKEFGYAEMSDLIDKDIEILVGGEHSIKHGEYMKRFNEKKKTSTILGQSRQVMALRKDGTEFPCRIGIKAVPDTNLLVGFIRDITEEKRAMALSIEKMAAEELLHNMLPQDIALRLKNNPGKIADQFMEATILFADIAGFTSMSNKLEPIEVVTFLNEIFSGFDYRLDKYGLNKVKTIGDCYMVTSVPGCTNPPKTCAAICHFAMDMIKDLEDYNAKHPGAELNMRIGVNIGPVVAGVVGTKRFLYDIWGDAVNVASRMESTGVPGKVQVTSAVINILPNDEFTYEKRGKVTVKGIGEMETYFLTARVDRSKKYWKKVRTSILSPSLLDRLTSLEILETGEQLDKSLRENERVAAAS